MAITTSGFFCARADKTMWWFPYCDLERTRESANTDPLLMGLGFRHAALHNPRC
jgi:hypothetical protein